VVSLESEKASEELAQRARAIRKKLDKVVEDAVKRPSMNSLISLDRWFSSHILIKSMDISKIPSICVITISIGTEDMKKKYAI
jgi:hypothetical protein